MDIRIGNDIRLNVAISDFEILPEESIKCAHCFLMSEAEKNLSNVDPKSIALPTKYTLRHSRGRIYNVLPINAQVRPHCGGPGFFGKSLRQYGKPVFTRVVENIEPEDPTDTGWIYGYFQDHEQKITGDYYLAVMLVLESEKYGARSKRHIVIDYGYVFTLTMDGDVCPAEGIYVSKQKDKQPNTITWTTDPSTLEYNIGDDVTFAASAVSGNVTFNKQSPVKFTGDGMTIIATSANTETYVGQTDTKVLRQKRSIPNTVTFNPPASVAYGTEVTLQASAVSGDVTFTAVDSSNNSVSIIDNKVIVTDTITVTATSASINSYVSKSVTKVIKCSSPVFYGYSTIVPDEVDFTNSISLNTDGNTVVSITTSSTDHAKCHWIALISDSGYDVIDVRDDDNVSLLDIILTKTVGDYTIFYNVQERGYILNTTKFTISK